MKNWSRLLIFLIAGYLAMSRSFAYLGFPPAKLFIGELTIAAFLLFHFREIGDRILSSIFQSSYFGGFCLAFLCSLVYGVVELCRGFSAGYEPILALQGFAFHYYPVCFFIGLWAAARDADLLPRVVWYAAWANGIYGLLYLVILDKIYAAVPGTTDVLLFGQPAGSAIAILGLLCVGPRISRAWLPILINLLVLLSLQVRAEYLGFTIGLLVWSLLTRRFGYLIAGYATIAAILIIGLLIDFRVQAPGTRGGFISSREIAGRVIAPVDLDLAQQLDPQAKAQAGTTTWRMNWWRAIWDKVHETTETALLGEGYGYPIAHLVGYKERDIRTPHSIAFYALAYGGWVGVAIFAMLQLSLAQVQWFSWKVSAIPFGLVLWLAFLVGACFGNAFETPFGAIPFYLLNGMCAAPLLGEESRYAAIDSPQLVSAARW